MGSGPFRNYLSVRRPSRRRSRRTARSGSGSFRRGGARSRGPIPRLFRGAAAASAPRFLHDAIRPGPSAAVDRGDRVETSARRRCEDDDLALTGSLHRSEHGLDCCLVAGGRRQVDVVDRLDRGPRASRSGTSSEIGISAVPIRPLSAQSLALSSSPAESCERGLTPICDASGW